MPKIRGGPHEPFQVSSIKYERIFISMVEVPLIDESIFHPQEVLLHKVNTCSPRPPIILRVVAWGCRLKN
jgi:hypothetical protein